MRPIGDKRPLSDFPEIEADPLLMNEPEPYPSWFFWLLPAFLVGLCLVLVVTA